MMKLTIRVALALLTILASSELILRLFIIAPAAVIADDELGWLFRPRALIINSSEGYAHNTMDEMGFNNDEAIQNIREPILVIFGDSYTEALQVDRSVNFVSRANSNLECIDLYNTGRSGMSIIHYPILLDRLRQKRNIDNALIILTAGDIRDLTSSSYIVIRDGDDSEISSIELVGKTPSKLRMHFDQIFSHSALATYLKNRLKAFQVANRNVDHKLEEKLTHSIENIDEVKEIIRYLLRSMEKATDLEILYVPSYDYLAGRTTEETNTSIKTREIIQPIAEGMKIPFQSVNGFNEIYKTRGRPPVGFSNKNIISGHLNHFGHEKVAENIVALYQHRCSDVASSYR